MIPIMLIRKREEEKEQEQEGELEEAKKQEGDPPHHWTASPGGADQCPQSRPPDAWLSTINYIIPSLSIIARVYTNRRILY